MPSGEGDSVKQMATVLRWFKDAFGTGFLDLPAFDGDRPPQTPANIKLPNVRAFLAAGSHTIEIHHEEDHADLWAALCSYTAFRDASARTDTTASMPRTLQVRLVDNNGTVRQVYVGRAVWHVALMNACWRLPWAHNVRDSAEVPTALLNACSALPGGTRALFMFDMPLRFDPPSEPNHVPYINASEVCWYHLQLYYIAHGLATAYSANLPSVMEHIITKKRHPDDELATAATEAISTLDGLRRGNCPDVSNVMLQRVTSMMCVMTKNNGEAGGRALFNTTSARARHDEGDGRYMRIVSGRKSSLDDLRAALDMTILPDTASTLDTLVERFGANHLRVLALTRGGSYRAEVRHTLLCSFRNNACNRWT